MTRLCSSLTLLIAISAAYGQRISNVGAASMRYEDYRLELTTPLAAFDKVDALMKTIHGDAVSNAVWKGMSVEEKFTYTMLHAEGFAQNCFMMPILAGEENMIFGHVPGPFAGFNSTWSDRQRSFLTSHRTQVIGLVRQTMLARGRVGVNLKNAIVLVNGYELIPDMLAIYRRDRKDQDILATCLAMMHSAKYKPFMGTPIYKSLYGNDVGFQAHIVATTAIEDQTMNSAMAFYRSKS